jgi:hypothetical protein
MELGGVPFINSALKFLSEKMGHEVGHRFIRHSYAKKTQLRNFVSLMSSIPLNVSLLKQ